LDIFLIARLPVLLTDHCNLQEEEECLKVEGLKVEGRGESFARFLGFEAHRALHCVSFAPHSPSGGTPQPRVDWAFLSHLQVGLPRRRQPENARRKESPREDFRPILGISFASSGGAASTQAAGECEAEGESKRRLPSHLGHFFRIFRWGCLDAGSRRMRGGRRVQEKTSVPSWAFLSHPIRMRSRR
jgi:hypothetical protein